MFVMPKCIMLCSLQVMCLQGTTLSRAKTFPHLGEYRFRSILIGHQYNSIKRKYEQAGKDVVATSMVQIS